MYVKSRGASNAGVTLFSPYTTKTVGRYAAFTTLSNTHSHYFKVSAARLSAKSRMV